MAHFKGRKGLTDVQYLSSFFSGLAIQDYLSGNTTWNNTVTQLIGAWTNEFGIYGASGASTGYTPDANYWALAFYYAYRTYKESSLLDEAVRIHNITNSTCFITPVVAAGGTEAGWNGTYVTPSNCTHGTRL